MMQLEQRANQEPNWDDLDIEMIKPVKALRKAGWKTFACCSGHGVRRAWIRVLGQDKDVAVLARDFSNAGYNQFVINTVHSYTTQLLDGDKMGNVNISNDSVFLELRAWGCLDTPGFARVGDRKMTRIFANS